MSFVVKHSVSIIYDDITTMLTDSNLKAGMVVGVLGYHTKGDCPTQYFSIEEPENPLTVDNGKVFRISSSLYAVCNTCTEPASVKMYGAYGDGVHDDTDAIVRCLENNDNIIFGNNEIYNVGSGEIKIKHFGMTVNLNGSTLKFKDEKNGAMIEINHSDITYSSELFKNNKERKPVSLINGTIEIVDNSLASQPAIIVKDIISDLYISGITILNNQVSAIYICENYRDDGYSDDTNIYLLNNKIKAYSDYNTTTTGIKVERDNVTISDSTFMDNFIGIYDSGKNTKISNVNLSFNTFPDHIETVSKALLYPKAIYSLNSYIDIDNCYVYDYYAFLYTVDNPTIKINNSTYELDDNYPVDNSYAIYYYYKNNSSKQDIDTTDITVDKFIYTGSNGSLNQFTNIGNSLAITATNCNFVNVTNKPIDNSVYKVLSLNSNEYDDVKYRYNNTDIDKSCIGTVSVRPYNDIKNMYYDGCGTITENLGHTYLYLPVKEEKERNRQPVPGDIYFLSFVLENIDVDISFSVIANVRPKDYETNSSSYNEMTLLYLDVNVYRETVLAGEKRRIYFTICLDKAICDKLNERLTSTNNMCLYSWSIEFMQTGSISVNDTSKFKMTNPFVTRLDAGDMMQYWYESNTSIIESVYKPYVNSFGLNNCPPQCYTHATGLYTTINEHLKTKRLKLMSIPWISNLVPYHNTRYYNNNYYGNNPFMNDDYFKDDIEIIPEPCGFTARRKYGVTDFNPELYLDIFTIEKCWFKKDTTLYFNADISSNGVKGNDGTLQVFIDGQIAKSYTTNMRDKKSIDLSMGNHDITFRVIFADDDDYNGLTLSVKNFFITESINEEIFSIDICYSEYYKIPLYKNGYLVATPVSDIDTSLSNTYENAVLSYKTGRGQINVTYSASESKVKEYLENIVYPKSMDLTSDNNNTEGGSMSSTTMKFEDGGYGSFYYTFFTPYDTTETEVSYKSSNESVCKVTKNGRIIMVGVGATTVTAETSNGLTKALQVTLTQ